MKALVAFALFTLSLAPVHARAQVNVTDAWVRATVPQQKATGAYMRLTATRNVRLTIAAENYAGWAQRDTLWLNTQANGAGTTENVLNFPVLVRLDSAGGFSSVFTQSVGRGRDLRFTKANNPTRLPHQVEQWDSAGRSASVRRATSASRASSAGRSGGRHKARNGESETSLIA